MFFVEDDLTGVGVGVAFYLIYTLVVAGIGIAQYVLQSLGFYTIAKRRGIKHPGLSWVPVLNVWILGSISDQYQYVAKGQVKNKRKAMLTLSILSIVGAVVVIAQCIAMTVKTVGYSTGYGYEDVEEGFVMGMLGILAGIGFVSLVLIGVSIALAILEYIALYDLYGSCDPQNKVLYLVLSILFSVTMPVFVFVCRNKDEGMPPRRPTANAYIPQQPDQQAPWHPVQDAPAQDPWEDPKP